MLATRAELEGFAVRDDVPGAAQVLSMKFLIVGVDTVAPDLWLIDTHRYSYHYAFATDFLRMTIALPLFNAQTYFTDARKNIAGTIVAHDTFAPDGTAGEPGLYALEFWPTDPVKARHVSLAFDLIAKGLPFSAGRLAYHPAGDTQEHLAELESEELSKLGVRVVSTTVLFAGVTYSPLNPGVGFGTLRVIDGTSSQPLTVRDVVLFKRSLPNDIAHVGGIITEVPQTPLSHINLKAKQNKTPNAYFKDASRDRKIAELVGHLVRYEVGATGLNVRAAGQQEADAWLEALRPPVAQQAPRDLSRTEVEPFGRLGAKDARAFGAKSANIAELRKLLKPETVPDGFAIPFSFYDAFMKAEGLYERAAKMIGKPGFVAEAAERDKKLKAFRKQIEQADVPKALARQIQTLQQSFPAGVGLRCRSSTNNEDLEGFNGAGLYDSFTHRPDEGDLVETVKQVWASLWTFRAFEEREFWRIDHFSAAMGVTVHPNTDDEVANGVAITKNIYDANWPGFYVNAQVGESLVTNPEADVIPDEMLISAIGPNDEYEVQKIRSSSLVEPGADVLTREQLEALVSALDQIQQHFKLVYAGGDGFAMDVEFKILKGGQLWIKQARPVVE